MSYFTMIAIYSVVIVLCSLLGGSLPTFFRLSHTRLQVILSFVGGLMLGIGLLHLLPHGVVHSKSLDLTINATLMGLLCMFFLIRTFHFHQHDVDPEAEECELGHAATAPHEHQPHARHGTPIAAGHPAIAPPHHVHTKVHQLSWLGVAAGLSLHTLLDGLALGAAVTADMAHVGVPPWGLGVFLAIALHKPLDALSITTLMSTSGYSVRAQMVTNVCFALMCPLGAVVFGVGLARLPTWEATILGATLGFSAGTFLCISLSDLLPEVQFHQHDRLKLSSALVLGISTAYAIRLLEGSGLHSFPLP